MLRITLPILLLLYTIDSYDFHCEIPGFRRRSILNREIHLVGLPLLLENFRMTILKMVKFQYSSNFVFVRRQLYIQFILC